MSGHTDKPTERLYGLTLTGPGEKEHCRRHRKCTGDLHPECDRCPCTVEGGSNIAGWNSTSGKRFNAFITRLRKEFGDVQYGKGAEVQDRGALHFHLMIRTDALLDVVTVRRIAIEVGFGHSVDLDCLKPIPGTNDIKVCSPRKKGKDFSHMETEIRVHWAAYYCSKYVSKACDDRATLQWVDGQGEIVSGQGRYRTWTASRCWGLSMKALKQSQAAFATGQAGAGDPNGVALPVGGGVADPLDPKTKSYALDMASTHINE